jgi:hypothetical protein
MKLWTYHHEDFRIDDPCGVVDPTKGPYHKRDSDRFQYRRAYAALQARLRVRDFLFCCLTRNNSFRETNLIPSDRRTDWEIEIPQDDVLAFLCSSRWVNAIETGTFDWEEIIIPHNCGDDIEALERLTKLVLVG